MRRYFLLSAGILALTSASAAFAGPTDRSAPDTRPAPHAATPDGDGDVIVTARHRPEDAQKIPGSLSVVTGGLLDRSYTVNTSQLSQLIPALNYSSANPRNTAFTIRGLGSSVVAVSQANDGLESGVGFYVDQVYHARPATAAFDFSDIQQIEVLRGPQGTLFGKNSTAGAINVTTRAPSFERAATEEFSFGNYDFVQAKASATGALIGDTVAFRLSGLVTRRDGVITNVRTGDKLNGIGNQAVRGQLLFTPNADLQIRLIADFTNFDSECCTQVYLRVAPTLKPAAKQYAALAANVPGGPYTPASFDPYARKTDIDAAVGANTNEGGVSAIADWKIGGATLTSVSAWRFWNWDAANDRDYTGLPIQLTQHIPSRQDQFSQELRIASNGDHALSYVGGLYFFRQRIIGRPISVYGPLAAYWLIGPTMTTGTAPNQVVTPVPANLLDGFSSDGRTDFRSNSYAAFGEVNWRPLPGLTVTGGLRYTYEDKSGSYKLFTFGGLATANAALNSAKQGILRDQSYSGAVRGGALTGRANLSYAFSDDVLGYVSYARGAKSGGINMSGLPPTALDKIVIKPEENTAYEAGIKTRLFDRRLTLNIDGFYTKVTDFQANVTDTGAAAALRTYLANIPEVRVLGFEADANAAVTRNFSLRASVAYADGKYVSYPTGSCPIERIANGATVCDLSGKGLSGLPKWALTVGADYDQPVGNGANLLFHADMVSRTKMFGDPTDSAYTAIDGYTLVNASLGLQLSSGLEVAVFARNLFNRDYIQNVTIQSGNSGLILGTPSDPRTFGITLRARQ